MFQVALGISGNMPGGTCIDGKVSGGTCCFRWHLVYVTKCQVALSIDGNMSSGTWY